MRKLFLLFGILVADVAAIHAQRQMEFLDRGVVAVRKPEGNVFVSWRLLATEPQETAFNVYRSIGNGKVEKLNKEVVSKTTHFIDTNADSTKAINYFVKSVLKGKEGTARGPSIYGQTAVGLRS